MGMSEADTRAKLINRAIHARVDCANNPEVADEEVVPRQGCAKAALSAQCFEAQVGLG